MKMSTFQMFFMAALVVVTILGVIIFAFHGGIGSKNKVGKVVIWGTVDKDTMDSLLQDMRAKDPNFSDVIYIRQDPATYYATLVNAMAGGGGPDMVILPQDEILTFSDKIDTIPYSIMSQGTYTNAFIDEAQIFLTPKGFYAFPFTVDPLVMYWNRDIFANAGLPRPPQYWADVLDITPKITVGDPSSGIQKSTIALGEWDNVLYAKDILAMLFLQAGDPITAPPSDEATQGKYQVVLGGNKQDAQEIPAVSALQFFTDFANPAKTSYTWNKVLPASQDAFVAGDLAIYIGYSSDYKTIISRNPNLNFGVALMPQVKGNGARLTFGHLLGLAVPRTAANTNGAVVIAADLAGQAGVAALAKHSTLPPVRRDVNTDTSASAAASVFTQSALIAHAWLDPNPVQTDDVFKTMINSVLSGASLPNEAVANAGLIMSQQAHPQMQQ
jgi:ABC-type glycerol-3-phosphate transport system substrate-binding protein